MAPIRLRIPEIAIGFHAIPLMSTPPRLHPRLARTRYIMAFRWRETVSVTSLLRTIPLTPFYRQPQNFRKRLSGKSPAEEAYGTLDEPKGLSEMCAEGEKHGKNGDFVRSGQVLLEIDPGTFQAALAQAEGL